MKEFKKIALAAAVCAALPVSGFAMEAMEDDALSAVTGQDGITISMTSVGAFDIFVADGDAFTGNVGTLGGIYIDNFDTGAGATTIVIDSDNDTIQANISLGAGTIALGNISAAASATAGPGATLISMGSLTHTGININVQLGAQDQGNFAEFSGTITGGITLTGFTINDTNGGGAITVDVQMDDAGAANTDLTLSGALNVDANGLQLTGLPSVDLSLNNLNVGGTGDIGDITIIGLTTPDITIAGH